MKNKPSGRAVSIAIVLGLLALSPPASAQLFWDGPHIDDTTIEGGTGTWNDTNLNWADAGGVGGNPYFQNTDVIFSGAAGIVTLGSDITCNGNSIGFSTDGYVINPNGFVLEIVNSVSITVDAGLEGTINAPLTEFESSESLTKSGAGTLILSGVNTYSDITAINAGVLSISQDANLGTAPDGPVANQLTFDGGTLQATASFALNTNRGITLLAGGGTIGVTGANVLTYDGVITGAGSLTKSDAGTLILSGVNTYSGITAINAGVLSISQDANLGTPPGAPVANQLTFDGGTLQATASFTLNPNRGVTLNAGGGTFDVTGANLLTYGGVITGAGNLTKVGTGTLTLSGTSTYAGATLVSAGILQAGSATAFSASSAFTVNAQLDLNGFSNTIGSLAGNGIVTNNGVALATLAIGNANTNTTFSGNLQDGTSSTSTLGLTKIGTGTLTLSGANTYSGGTNLNGGILAVQSDANLGTGALLSFSGGTLQALAGGGIDSSKAITLNVGGGTFLADAGTASTLRGAITGLGAWTKAGPGTLTLTGANTYSGGTTVSAGTLQLGAGGTTGSITGNVANNGILAFNRSDFVTFNGLISGTGSVQQNGTGTIVLVANNTYTGGTTINAGALQLGAGGTTGSIVGNVTNDGILAFNRSDSVTFNGLISGTGAVQQNGTGTTVLIGSNTYTGGTTVNAGALQLGNGGTTGSIVGNVIDNGILAFNRSDSVTFNGLISGTGAVQQNGTGTTVLVANNTYTGGTIINAGALQLGAGGTTGSIVGNVIDNGILAFNRSDSVTFNGLISGTGAVQQNGTGTTVLIGNNTYTGGTTINAGALQIGNGGTTGSIVGNVIDNGALIFNRSDVVSFGGLISGTGSVQQNGTGTTVLVGENTYTGGTTINAGALQLGAGGTTGSIVGNVIDNGALIFNRSDVVSFGGLISGTGSVQQNGTGTTVLVGDNTYTGGTIINEGALQLGAGGTTGSIVGNVIDNGALIFNRSDAVSFGGVISGTGNLVKLGTGTLTLPGANTYTGTTTVNGGSLIVDGSIASANTLVNPGGLLGGSGVIGGNLVNSGVVSPGSSPGTLTVNGDYTQNPSGTLRIEVAGLAPSQHDLLAVNGHASVAGTLQLVRVGDFNLRVGDQITFLTASNGVSGTFGNVENDFLVTGSLVVFDVIYLPNGVVLEGTQGSFAQFADAFCGTPNALAVGQALDSAVGDPRASELIGFLNNQTLSDLCDNIDLISPEQLSSIFVIGVSLANVQTANLERRLDDIRAGSSGFSSAGFAINGSGPSFSEGFAGVSGPEGKSGQPVFAPIPQNRWGVFVTGIGEFTNVESTFNASGYDLATGGFTMGIDYRIGSHFAIGLTGGYAYTHADLVNNSSIAVNGGKLGLYATAFGSGFYLDTAVIGGLNGYDTRRTALEGTASGDTVGGDLNVLVAGGYDWKKGGLSIGPTVSFQYTYVGLDDFSESGSLAPLAFPDQHAESFRTAFGMKASYDWKIGPIHLIPEVRTAWQHEFGDTDYSLVSSFANGAGNSFTVNGPEIGRDSLLLSAGFAIHWNDRISTYAYYDGELFRTNYLSNNVSAGFRLTF